MGNDNYASNPANWSQSAPNDGLHFTGMFMPSSRKPCIFDLGSAGDIYIGPYYGSTVTFDTSASGRLPEHASRHRADRK